MAAPRISPAQVRWFRLRRSGLVEPYPSPEVTAHRLLGVQAQMPAAAALAFWNRTAGCTASDLSSARLERRSLVRFWGQRDTVHIFSAGDWPLLHTVLAGRQESVLRKLQDAGLLADFRRLVARTRKRLAADVPLTHKDIKSKRLEEGQDRWAVSYLVFGQLVRDGVACHGPDRGSQSTFVHRQRWLPGLEWSPPSPTVAFPELACRYLAAYGPAEPHDLAFWCGTTLTNARRWIEAAGERLTAIACGKQELWCRAEDLGEIASQPPPTSRWPVRLLHRFDPLLLATRDKSWLIDDEHYKKVWRAAAHVEPVLLAHGRIQGTWRYDRKAKGLHLRVRAFAPLSRTVLRFLEKQAAGIAGFLDLPLASLEVTTASAG